MIPMSRKEVMRRVCFNLGFVDERRTLEGPFEVTQLLSSFLLTLHLNWDDLDGRWDQLSQKGIGWPKIEQEGLQQAKQAIGKMRDALAHGLIAFESDPEGEIDAIHLWTCSRQQTVDWDARLSVEQVRQMLKCFVRASAEHVGDFHTPCRRGEPCKQHVRPQEGQPIEADP